MKGIFVFVFFILHFVGFSQFDEYQSYYRFPINPGQTNYLAGTIGEIRAAHFHTGIDVKTGGAIGWPVYATADGYINRIKISTGGYGQALYMAHPNGTYSVYAHLDSFEENIQQFVIERQYEKESYAIELFPKQNQFYFKKGELIGYAGNTGSSSGPHLHFEIRDSQQRPMDLLQFGFKEVNDRLPPIVRKVAFITLDQNARVNELFGRYEFDLIKVKNTYRLTKPILLEGRIGVEIYSYDPMDGVHNKNGIIKTTMLVDGDTVFHENKGLLTFGKQRNTLKHFNYRAYRRGSRKFNKLYLDDGNEHNIYSKTNRGIYFDEQQKIQIFTLDSYQNLSATEISINSDDLIYPLKTRFRTYEIIGNKLHFKSKNGGVRVDEWEPIDPYYSNGMINYYLWEISNGLPRSIFIDGKTISTDLVASIPPNQKISYHQQEFETSFTHRSLFDTVHLAFKKELDSVKNQEMFKFINHQDPLRSNVTITLKPDHLYDTEKSSVYSVFGRRRNYFGGDWQGNEITFKTRDLVTYTILTDSIPPTIKAVGTAPGKLLFRIKDDLSGIKSYKAFINGKFLLMRYEAKRNLIWSVPRESNIRLKGELLLEVIDNENNKTEYKQTL
ncbi:MAG: M23 family metallopeptidase [Bacteroidota bacterium]